MSSARVPSGPRAVAFKRMSQEDPRAYQTHQCRNRLDHLQIPIPPLHARKRGRPCTVKRIPVSAATIGVG